nr:MAG TPA: hypothetical protein [Caudoviricetes sp.]
MRKRSKKAASKGIPETKNKGKVGKARRNKMRCLWETIKKLREQ